LTGIAIMMLAADSVAPVPATLVIMYLAAKGGVVAGILGGTLGLSAGVLAAAWFGRTAVGRIAPKFFPEAELTKLREALQRRLALTLACLRSVPVLAETSVILAAATGVPVKKIFLATLGPNLVVAVIYSVSADDSATTAAITFIGTIAASWVLWRWLGREKRPD
jgi:3-dehydroquinate synthase